MGQKAVAVRDVNLREAEDGPIWQYALEHGTVIVTKDGDFPERSPAPRIRCSTTAALSEDDLTLALIGKHQGILA